jgi:hypothetical protein
MEPVTSKTHRYISVRTVPSDYILDKFHKGDLEANKKLQTTYKEYFDFYREYFEKATGLSFNEYICMNYFDSMEVSKEYLREITGVKVAIANNHEIFCFPKTPKGNELYELMLSTIPCKIKLLQKTVGTYYDRGVETWRREAYKHNLFKDGKRL